jgi:hypothetical protein
LPAFKKGKECILRYRREKIAATLDEGSVKKDAEKKPQTRPDQFLLAESKAKSAFFRTKPLAPDSKPGFISIIKKLLGLRG